mgnify:CR=1 FL=1
MYARIGAIRDFKPDNVMIGKDGRVRVMDFGVARAAQAPGGQATPIRRPELPRQVVTALQTDMTQAGSILGTPAYMAPEQWFGHNVDARTDQFSFCVALWEALFGARPFAGGTLTELITSVTAGERMPAPRAPVPSWVRRVVERGLAVDPDKRWPSMSALLVALTFGERRRRRRNLAAIALAIGAAGAGLAGVRHLDHERRIATCVDHGREISGTWNTTTATAMRDAMLATGARFAATSADRVVASVDPFVVAWSDARRDACIRSDVDLTWDRDTATRADDCLLEMRWSLAGLLDILTRADAAAVERAAQAAAGLPRPAACLDAAALANRPRPPHDEAARTEAAEIRRALEHALSLRAAGRYADGLAEAEALVPRADALEFPPLAARTRIVVGGLRVLLSDPASARSWLVDGLVLAASAGADELVADAASELTGLLSAKLGEYAEAREWGRLGEALLVRQGQLESPRGARLLHNLANVDYGVGDYAAAEAGHARVLAIREAVLGPQHPDLSASLNNLGLALNARGDHAASIRAQERALEIRKASLGPDHPELAATLSNLALAHRAAGDLATADELNRQALALAEAALGPDHPTVANILNTLASVAQDQGHLEEARTMLERSIAIRVRTLGPEHSSVATSQCNLAGVLLNLGEVDAARRLYDLAVPQVERTLGPDHPSLASVLNNAALAADPATARRYNERALAIRERTIGPDHPDTAMSLNNLANDHREAKEFDAAMSLYARAITAWEKTLGPDHPNIALSLLGSGEILLAQNRPAEAVARFERACALRAAALPDVLAQCRFVLARGLWAQGDRPRARELANQALAGYPEAAKPRADITAWLATH